MRIECLLIANRGEIASRIIRSCQQLGIDTVAVYTPQDAHACHVAEATYSVPIADYRAQQQLLDIAQHHHCQAVHPGYGFLSENAEFAQACQQRGILFVGPDINHLQQMGSKCACKRLMEDAGLPILPTLYQPLSIPLSELERQVEYIGYPVVVKASQGAGGRGIRRVDHKRMLPSALDEASHEAKACFGNDTIFIEKFIDCGRHIEVQIFGDRHGAVTHLFERECSIQRRHQKIIEEAPAPHLSKSLRHSLLTAAVTACKHIGYVGAGTIEFLVKGDAFFFMEMNPRLQVEHPVTEAITGCDLVAWQLQIAQDEPLPTTYTVDDPADGHAIEVRLCAEDPQHQFMPQTGTVTHLQWPQSHRLRIDAGITQGETITTDYDPMLGKLIGYGQDRAAALFCLESALPQTIIHGIQHNLDFLQALLQQPVFVQGNYHTRTLEQLPERDHASSAQLHASLLLAFLLWQRRQHVDPWLSLCGFEIGSCSGNQVTLLDRHHHSYRLEYQVITENELLIDGICLQKLSLTPNQLSLLIDGNHHHLTVTQSNKRYWITATNTHCFHLPQEQLASTAPDQGSLSTIRSPIPGRITNVHCHHQQAVTKGQVMMVIEAMKMAYHITAPHNGKVMQMRHKAGDVVALDEHLIVIEPTIAADGDPL